MPRPKLNIDTEDVAKLARIGASNVDIANFFGCDEGTIRKRFSEILIRTRADRKNTLRRWQWEAAERGNVKMLIWLGKQELGQTDKTDVTSLGKAIGQHPTHEDRHQAIADPIASEHLCSFASRMVGANGHAGGPGGDGLSRPMEDAAPPGPAEP